MNSLSSEQVSRLREYVSVRVEQQGCNRSHRFAQEWVAIEQINWDDVLDLLESNGSYCDCEAAYNLPENAALGIRPEASEDRTDWHLPPGWAAAPGAVFTRIIVCKANVARNTHSLDRELLVPPPAGTRPRKRVRASVHFFVGCESGLPSEVGVVAACEPISAEEFAHRVRRSRFDEFRCFSPREASFVLSRVSALEPGTPVGTHFMEVSGVVGKRQELRIHKVIVRRDTASL